MESFIGTILVVDDDADVREVLRDRLDSLGYRVLVAATGKESLDILERQNPQMVLLDVEMPGMNGLEVLKEIRKREHDVAVVMITAYGTLERAVQAMREGAYDFIPKPFEPEHIALIVKKAMERETLRRGVELLSEEVDDRHRLVVGQSALLNRALETIHNWSDRKDHPFIAINCVGLSKELLESELFGHEKGAFTGAVNLKKGKMELGHGGTVFLDEVGDVSTELQTKLLRFLQEREFERVGGTKLINVDVRIIAATNRDLDSLIQKGRFREDLYYRLNVVLIALPPLRERKDDIPVLANYFLRRFAVETKKSFTQLTQETLEKLIAYDWPGNVRELANVIESTVVLGQGPMLTASDLPAKIFSVAPARARDAFSYHQAIESYRRELILKVLTQTHGSRAAAAQVLGIQRTYLSRLIKTLRIG